MIPPRPSSPLLIAALACGLALPAAAPAQNATLLDCDACHLAGAGDRAARLETARYPDIAGHPARYIARQLRGYREGLRLHRQMTRTAIALGEGAPAAARRYAASPVPRDLDREAVAPGLTSATAAASQGAIAPAQPSARAADAPLDVSPDVPRLVAQGDWSRGLAPCASCHAGPHRAALAPPLRGQPEEYLAAALHAYAEGTRRTDPMGRMRAYAARLEAGEIARLAAWYADAPRTPDVADNAPAEAAPASERTQRDSP